MLRFIQQVQSQTWRDLSGFSKTKQVTTVEVIETKSSDDDSIDSLGKKPLSAGRIESPYIDDVAFAKTFNFYLSPDVKKRAEAEISMFSEAAVSNQVMGWVAEAESFPLQVQHWDAWWVKKDELVTSQGWKYLWQFGISERYVLSTIYTCSLHWRLIQ